MNSQTQREPRFAPWLIPELVQESRNGFNNLLQMIKQGVFVTFFVGAGISVEKPTLLPVAWDLKEYIINLWLNSKSSPNSVSYPYLSQIPLEKVLDIGLQVFGEKTVECIPSIFLSAKPNRSHSFLAWWIQKKKGAVLTTNWDELIEECAEETPSSNFGAQLQAGNIYKLHGTASNPQSLIATVSSLKPSLKGPVIDRIGDAFKRGPICFVGWRGADIDLVPIVRDCMNSTNFPIFLVALEQANFTNKSAYMRAFGSDSVFVDKQREVQLIVSRSSAFFNALAHHFRIKFHSINKSSFQNNWRQQLNQSWMTSNIINTLREQRYILALLDSHIQKHESAKDAFIDLAKVEEDPHLKATFWRLAGHRCVDMEDYTRAIEFTNIAREIARKSNDDVTEAWSLFGLGSIATVLGPKARSAFKLAPKRLQEAAHLFHGLRRKQATDALLGEGSSLAWYWRWHHLWSNRDKKVIIAGYKKALRLLRHERCSEPTEAVNPLHWMAQLENCLSGRRYAIEAVRISRAVGSVQRLTTCLNTLATVEARCGNIEIAQELWWEMLQLARNDQTSPLNMPDFRGVRLALGNLIRIYKTTSSKNKLKP